MVLVAFVTCNLTVWMSIPVGINTKQKQRIAASGMTFPGHATCGISITKTGQRLGIVLCDQVRLCDDKLTSLTLTTQKKSTFCPPTPQNAALFFIQTSKARLGLAGLDLHITIMSESLQ